MKKHWTILKNMQRYIKVFKHCCKHIDRSLKHVEKALNFFFSFIFIYFNWKISFSLISNGFPWFRMDFGRFSLISNGFLRFRTKIVDFHNFRNVFRLKKCENTPKLIVLIKTNKKKQNYTKINYFTSKQIEIKSK